MEQKAAFYIRWPLDPDLWIDRVPQSFLSQPDGPVETLMVESECGQSMQVPGWLSRNAPNDVTVTYKKGQHWVAGELRIWLEDGEPRAEWHDAKGRRVKSQPEISREAPWGAPVGPRRTLKKRKASMVELRPEQVAFRNRALRVFSHRCAITGLRCTDALEAAHIWTYLESRDNTDGNCLLLRRDLHALFDRDLIGLDPKGKLHFANSEVEAMYVAAGDIPRSWKAGTPAPYLEAIKCRWRQFETARGKRTKD